LIGLDEMTQVISSEGITISKSKLSFYENSKRVFTLSPQINYYPKMNMLYSLPMADTTLLRDVQVLIKEWKNSMDGLTIFHVTINPLMIWIWIGGAMLVLGGAISLIKPRPN
jgi:cytochrome c-type biogenesis protein CcmF